MGVGGEGVRRRGGRGGFVFVLGCLGLRECAILGVLAEAAGLGEAFFFFFGGWVKAAGSKIDEGRWLGVGWLEWLELSSVAVGDGCGSGVGGGLVGCSGGESVKRWLGEVASRRERLGGEKAAVRWREGKFDWVWWVGEVGCGGLRCGGLGWRGWGGGVLDWVGEGTWWERGASRRRMDLSCCSVKARRVMGSA